MEPPHTGVLTADCIAKCIKLWEIEEKVQSIAVDNASSNDVAATCLKNNLISRNKLHFKSHIFYVRCAAHILNILVQDGIKKIAFATESIRETVKYLKKSPARFYKFGQKKWMFQRTRVCDFMSQHVGTPLIRCWSIFCDLNLF